MNFPQINLNQMQKVRCFCARSVKRTNSDKQFDIVEKGDMSIFSARESNATVADILKTINLQEL